MIEQTRDDRTTFTRITESIYWFVVLDVLLVLAALPTIVVWMLLAQDTSNIPLYMLSILFVFPAVAAAFYSWRKRSEDPDPVPARIFLRGYRLNVVDSLKIGVPTVLMLMVLSTNIAFSNSTGTGALNLAFLLIGVIVVLVATRALAIASTFSFRFVDIVRLSIFTLLTMPLRTLSLLSLGVLVLGISLFVGDYALLFTASLLTFAVWVSERPVIARIRADFVGDDDGAGTVDTGA